MGSESILGSTVGVITLGVIRSLETSNGKLRNARYEIIAHCFDPGLQHVDASKWQVSSCAELSVSLGMPYRSMMRKSRLQVAVPCVRGEPWNSALAEILSHNDVDWRVQKYNTRTEDALAPQNHKVRWH